ncbi:nitroreductase/quinone reductase family protein [Sphaerisporangium corydalis]|uniref:Nitroreductase/quinone reductase family protein n=1 Tax=Sphaerisporangium corydalis TaxID=1441875 RepID=A0ABV9E8U6_9ACTN|nr:nitroreductase/quinone reductase family protein [Sphaerisporangium corydalis]
MVEQQPSGGGVRRRVSVALRPFFQWLSTTRGFAMVAPAIVPPADRLLNRLTGGRVLMGDQMIPHLLLTTTGATTGQARQSPLACLPEAGGTFLVAGSNFGKDRHPAWSGNLIRNPAATITFRGRVTPVTGRLLEGTDRERAWEALNRHWPVYDGYTERSGRELRVFRLTPRPGSGDGGEDQGEGGAVPG